MAGAGLPTAYVVDWFSQRRAAVPLAPSRSAPSSGVPSIGELWEAVEFAEVRNQWMVSALG